MQLRHPARYGQRQQLHAQHPAHEQQPVRQGQRRPPPQRGELYTEQSAAKVQMSALDGLDPMSQDYLDKLDHIRGAVAHHVYEEKNDYFHKLKKSAGSALQSKLSRKYREEFKRYVQPAMVD